jgi:hypothetical protein
MITTYHISNAPIHEVKTWIRNNAHGKHAENYKNIEFDSGYKAITIERDKVITCISSVYQRDFYPKKCVRIFNRWITTRKIGGTKENILSDRAIKTATQQIYFAEMMGYTSFFISYHSYIPRFCNSLSEKLSEKTEWKWKHVPLVQVVPSQKKTSYQHVIYTGDSIDELINRRIDLNLWRKLC